MLPGCENAYRSCCAFWHLSVEHHAFPNAAFDGSAYRSTGHGLPTGHCLRSKAHLCAALPYAGRVGEANLAAFLRNPQRYNPKTAITFPGLKSAKDTHDVIAYIMGGR
jgi:hypothetical protein